MRLFMAFALSWFFRRRRFGRRRFGRFFFPGVAFGRFFFRAGVRRWFGGLGRGRGRGRDGGLGLSGGRGGLVATAAGGTVGLVLVRSGADRGGGRRIGLGLDATLDRCRMTGRAAFAGALPAAACVCRRWRAVPGAMGRPGRMALPRSVGGGPRDDMGVADPLDRRVRNRAFQEIRPALVGRDPDEGKPSGRRHSKQRDRRAPQPLEQA
jgi:hypothetical protein